jgi:hypothetical protein
MSWMGDKMYKYLVLVRIAIIQKREKESDWRRESKLPRLKSDGDCWQFNFHMSTREIVVVGIATSGNQRRTNKIQPQSVGIASYPSPGNQKLGVPLLDKCGLHG